MTISVWNLLREECVEWGRSSLEAIPGQLGCRLRNAFYGFHAGPGCRVLRQVIIYFPERLTLGENVGVSCHTQLNAAGGIDIGDDTLIGPGCMIWSVNHRFASLERPIRIQGYEPAAVIIERDCWIAGHVVILPGVRIGEGSIVAAGAVVTTSCGPRSVLVGAPARVVRSRTETPSNP